jgi:hypothetical protein
LSESQPQHQQPNHTVREVASLRRSLFEQLKVRSNYLVPNTQLVVTDDDLATLLEPAPLSAAAAVVTSFPASSTHQTADLEPSPPPPPSPTKSPLPIPSHAHIGELIFRRRRHIRPPAMWAQSCSFPPPPHPLRCHATEDHGCAPPLKPSSRAAILLQLKRSAVIGAPHHRMRLLKFGSRAGMAHPPMSSLLSVLGKWLSGQALPRRQETGSHHSPAKVVRGATPLSLGTQQP